MMLSLLTSQPRFSDDHKSPDAVEHFPSRVDPDVNIGHDDVVEVARLLVPEEGVRHPDLLGVGEGEVLHAAIVVIKPQSGIIPLLSEGDLHSKLLRKWETFALFQHYLVTTSHSNSPSCSR